MILLLPLLQHDEGWIATWQPSTVATKVCNATWEVQVLAAYALYCMLVCNALIAVPTFAALQHDEGWIATWKSKYWHYILAGLLIAAICACCLLLPPSLQHDEGWIATCVPSTLATHIGCSTKPSQAAICA
jgi:DNA mismatch repair protein MutH